MATNGDLKRWYGNNPSPQPDDFVRVGSNGKIPTDLIPGGGGGGVKFYKHMLSFVHVYAESGTSKNFIFISTEQSKITAEDEGAEVGKVLKGAIKAMVEYIDPNDNSHTFYDLLTTWGDNSLIEMHSASGGVLDEEWQATIGDPNMRFEGDTVVEWNGEM